MIFTRATAKCRRRQCFLSQIRLRRNTAIDIARQPGGPGKLPPPHTPNAHVPTVRAPASTQPTIHACARPTGGGWAFEAPPCLPPRTQQGGPAQQVKAQQVKVRRSIAAHSTDADSLTQWTSPPHH